MSGTSKARSYSKIEILGKRFGMLTVVEESPHKYRNGCALYVCRCDCGTTKGGMLSQNIRRAKSCGCMTNNLVATANSTHGKSRPLEGKPTPEYAAWHSMKKRCGNPANPNFFRYGARGIKVCLRWMKFENFLIDMGPRPDGTSLDRIDNDGNYTPENCRWATPQQQARNRSTTVTVIHEGQAVSLAEYAEVRGLDLKIVNGRRYLGWPEERWFEPVKRRARHVRA